MATSLKNLSDHNTEGLSADNMAFVIVVSEWNSAVTLKLLEGTVFTLKELGCKDEDILIEYVPGTYELPLAAKFLGRQYDPDAIICIGCVIQGETRHFDFISDAAANGIMNVGLELEIPVIFGVLTTDTQEQALERAGGKHGNKGTEAAVTAVKMVALLDRAFEDEDQDE
jgi:6,7-dimethyl-8-ribityllumazine synthase